MELEELKSRWNDYDKKLDKSLRLNMDLLKRINFDKARFKVRTLFVYKIVEMAILMACMSWITNYVIQYVDMPRFGIPALLIDLLLLAAVIADITQLSLIIQLQMNKHTDAIAPMQKQMETLKIRIVNYVRYSIWAIPLYPLLLILGAKIFMNMDLFAANHIHYLEINILVCMCLILLVLIPFRMLGKKTIQTKTAKTFLQGSGYYQITSAEQFLREVDEFGKDE